METNNTQEMKQQREIVNPDATAKDPVDTNSLDEEPAHMDQADLEHRKLLTTLAGRWVTVEPINALATMVMICSMPITQQYIYRRMAVVYNITNDTANDCQTG